jgi:hypothetical protein
LPAGDRPSISNSDAVSFVIRLFGYMVCRFSFSSERDPNNLGELTTAFNVLSGDSAMPGKPLGTQSAGTDSWRSI